MFPKRFQEGRSMTVLGSISFDGAVVLVVLEKIKNFKICCQVFQHLFLKLLTLKLEKTAFCNKTMPQSMQASNYTEQWLKFETLIFRAASKIP